MDWLFNKDKNQPPDYPPLITPPPRRPIVPPHIGDDMYPAKDDPDVFGKRVQPAQPAGKDLRQLVEDLEMIQYRTQQAIQAAEDLYAAEVAIRAELHVKLGERDAEIERETKRIAELRAKLGGHHVPYSFAIPAAVAAAPVGPSPAGQSSASPLPQSGE